MKIGILFGGPSREREIAFAGGRTVYDNLNKSIFEAVPIFIDSNRNFVLLDWQYIYKGTIRDFYPPVDHLPTSPNAFQIYIESLGNLNPSRQNEIISKIGRKIELSELSSLIDLAFLSLHGNYGEDGQIQGLLESLNIPYTGSGIRACSIGIDKAFQKKMMLSGSFDCPQVIEIKKDTWLNSDIINLFEEAKNKIGYPMVVRPANQGSSIGVSIINNDSGLEGFKDSIDAAFFRKTIYANDWNTKSDSQKVSFIHQLADIREALGFPLDVNNLTFYHPENLLAYLNEYFQNHDSAVFVSHYSEQIVIVEEFIHGKEFSCIVLRNENGSTVALPPTEIVKGEEVFDYRSKYLPGLSRKVTPIDISDDKINAIHLH